MLGERGGPGRAAAVLAERLAPRSIAPARLVTLAPPAVAQLVREVATDPAVAALTEAARSRTASEPLTTGASVELRVASFRALYLHFGPLTHVVAVPGTGAVAVIDGREVYRARHGAAVLHRVGSERVRDATCRECLAWTELAVLWSIRAVRDASAVAVAAGLGLAAARHCVVEVRR